MKLNDLITSVADNPILALSLSSLDSEPVLVMALLFTSLITLETASTCILNSFLTGQCFP